MKIINAVAKSVPTPYKVDLNNPDKNIVVQIVKVRCAFPCKILPCPLVMLVYNTTSF